MLSYRDIEKKVRRPKQKEAPGRKQKEYPREDYPEVVVSAMGYQDYLMSGSGGYLTPGQSLGQLMSERLLVTSPERPSNRASSHQ